MLLVDPGRILFENSNDVVDYVSRGLPPRKKDFERVMDAIHNNSVDNDVKIPDECFIINAEEFEAVLRRVYEANCRKRNALLIGLGVAAAACIGVKIAAHAKEKKELAEIDAEIDRWMVDHPEVTVERF